MTAAHCFYDNFGNLKVKDAFVTLGLDKMREHHLAIKNLVVGVLSHPDYFINPYLINVNDVAILELESNVIFNDKITPICMSDDGMIK